MLATLRNYLCLFWLSPQISKCFRFYFFTSFSISIYLIPIFIVFILKIEKWTTQDHYSAEPEESFNCLVRIWRNFLPTALISLLTLVIALLILLTSFLIFFLLRILVKVLSLRLSITLALCPSLLCIKCLCLENTIVLLFDFFIRKYVICSCNLFESILLLFGKFLALYCVRVMLLCDFVELILNLFLRCILAQTQTLIVIYIFVKE